MIDTPSPVAELNRELKALRQEITALRATIEQGGLRSLAPTSNAVSGEEFRGLDDEVLTLREAISDLRRRVETLEKREPNP